MVSPNPNERVSVRGGEGGGGRRRIHLFLILNWRKLASFLEMLWSPRLRQYWKLASTCTVLFLLSATVLIKIYSKDLISTLLHQCCESGAETFSRIRNYPEYMYRAYLIWDRPLFPILLLLLYSPLLEYFQFVPMRPKGNVFIGKGKQSK